MIFSTSTNPGYVRERKKRVSDKMLTQGIFTSISAGEPDIFYIRGYISNSTLTESRFWIHIIVSYLWTPENIGQENKYCCWFFVPRIFEGLQWQLWKSRGSNLDPLSNLPSPVHVWWHSSCKWPWRHPVFVGHIPAKISNSFGYDQGVFGGNIRRWWTRTELKGIQALWQTLTF